jgi:uncharacterized membrane protein
MHFAQPIAWWLALFVAAGAAWLAFVEYRRPLAPLSRRQRGLLIALRALALAALVVFLLRPVVMLPPVSSRGALVPVLVDRSRSMRLPDAGNSSRIDRATTLVKTELLPALDRQFQTEVYTFGDALAPANLTEVKADARRTELAASLDAIRQRYRGQRVAGLVVVSDGGDTTQSSDAAAPTAGPPVFAIGVGSPDGPGDREVLGITAGDPKLDHASVDLHVTATSHGFGRAPFNLRLLANGRVIETRRLVPPSDGSPFDEAFVVSPDPVTPTVYTAEIPPDEAETVVENNTRSVLVAPASRKRRILIVEGAPGFEHSFMKRAWALDPGFEIDAVTRKGKNAEGQNTFFVQAGGGRAAALTNGFPTRKDDLYVYDALVIANVEGDFFSRAQLAMAADFVAERGGGLLVLGGRSFAQRGLIGTPLEEALPVELNDRRGGLVRTSLALGAIAPHNKVMVTPEGEGHPIMRIGDTLDETRRLWAALPALAASAPLGGPRPGATVLAVTAVPGGGIYPVVAVQRYGRGRSMIFAGEASWRWKMMQASGDRTHEFFWRQAARWLATSAPDPVSIAAPDAPEPGDAVEVTIDARDAAFAAVPDATIDVTVTPPGGEAKPVVVRHADTAAGRFSATIPVDQSGLYRIHAAARRATTPLGSADRWVLVGGGDREFADPRLNEGFLRRLARSSGGRYVRAGEASRVVSWLRETVPQNPAPERRDLWHEPWAFGIVVSLLSAEWILRRRWGLR